MQTIIDKTLQFSVQFNGVLIPGNSVESSLARYAELLVVLNNSDTYPCSLMGSCVGIHYRDRYLLLCTRHQLKLLDGRTYEQIALLDKDGEKLCSSGGIRYFPELNEVEVHDLVVLDFTDPCNERPKMKERFLKLQRPPPVKSDGIVGFVVSGYPSMDQKYNIGDPERHLGLVKRTFVCELAPRDAQLSDPTSLLVTPVKHLGFNPDGMSGGPAFVITLQNGQAQAYLAGILTRANNTAVHILMIGSILNVIDAWLNDGL